MKEEPKMPIIKEIFAVDYAARNAEIIHYSNIRSALTTFLITIAIVTLEAHFSMNCEEKNASGYVLLYCSRLFLGVAVLICLNFSFKTEKAILKKKKIWKWAQKTTDNNYPYGYKPQNPEIRTKMVKDWVNWVLVAVTALIFYWTF